MEAQSPTFARTKAGLALTSLVLCGLAPWPSQAEDLNSLSIGVRASVGQANEYLATSSRKRFASTTSWRVFGCLGNAITRQAGASERDCWQALEFFKEEQNNALVFSFIPVLAVGSQDGRFVLDLGVGGALLSRHTFEKQDYGGHFQFALTARCQCSALRTTRGGLPIYALLRRRTSGDSHHGRRFPHGRVDLSVLRVCVLPDRSSASEALLGA